MQIIMMAQIYILSESKDCATDITDPQSYMGEAFVPVPTQKSDHGVRPKIPRRPAGGLSRPLPSPGTERMSTK